MFDTKKLLDALASAAPSSPAPAAAPAAPAPAPAPTAAPAAPSAPVLGAGTLLSDFIGYVTKDAPPQPPAEGEGPEGPPVPKTPTSPDLSDHLLAKAQDYLRSPQGNAAVNALVLGLAKIAVQSDAGKKLATTAKSGGLALIGQLTQRAKQLGAPAASVAVAPATPAPDDSGLIILRTMIAAAAADGHIDAEERRRITVGMAQAGIGPELAGFVESEFARPSSVAQIAASVKTPEMAAQVYTAARITIDPDKTEERVFLAHLSGALRLDPRLVASIDAAAAGA